MCEVFRDVLFVLMLVSYGFGQCFRAFSRDHDIKNVYLKIMIFYIDIDIRQNYEIKC